MNNTEGPCWGKQSLWLQNQGNLWNSVDYQEQGCQTTVQAERMLVEQADISRGKRKKVIDKLAAQLILQTTS